MHVFFSLDFFSVVVVRRHIFVSSMPSFLIVGLLALKWTTRSSLWSFFKFSFFDLFNLILITMPHFISNDVLSQAHFVFCDAV